VAIEAAIDRVLRDGPHSRDIGGQAGTQDVLDAVLRALDADASVAPSLRSAG
jgi:3-isopropylmalate dehydrogenase